MNKHILLLLTVPLFTGCIHNYYIPNVQNVPLFTEKGEFQLSGYLGGGEASHSFEMQSAMALTDNLGFAVNYMHSKDGKLAEDDFNKGNYIEAAIGYFHQVNKNGVFEIYGGLGTGGQHHQYKQHELDYDVYRTYYSTADLSYGKLYLQPAYGFKFNFCDLAFSTRISRLSYHDLNTNLDRENNKYSNLLSLTNESHFFIEPGITFRIGWKNASIQMQYIYSGKINNKHSYDFEKQHFSIGLIYSINKKNNQELSE